MTPSARAVDIGFRCAWSPAFEDLPGVVRGDLVPASPPTEPRPVATHEKLYQTVLTGLDLPGVVRSHSGYLYIAEKSAVTVLDAEGEATRIDDLEIAQWIADASRVYGIDRTSNTLWGFDGATHAEVFTVPDLKTAISHGEEWIWTDGTAINRLDADGGSTVVVNGRNGVNALAADGNTLVWTEAGTDGPILARIDLSAPEMTETLVGPDQIPNPLRLWGVRLVNAGEALLFVGMEGWPYSGLLCRYASNGGRLTCLGHSPPKPRDVIPTDAGYLWATQFGVFRLAAGQVERVGDPMSPGGFTTGEDKIWVTDRARGLLLELTR